jgi:cell wall-associated NlpC family hydrolase
LIKIGLTAVLIAALAGCASTSRTNLAPAQIMVDRALAMVGQPYRWGGAAPGGFDCSGLVEYSAIGAGIAVPRTAHQQLHAGDSVPLRQVRTGDLVFMHLDHKELHVGIAIDPQRFVHAPSTGGHVRIDSLTASPYADGLEAVRRITPH